LNAYTKFRGKWDGIYETVILSDMMKDEERFREIIDAAIESGDVQAYPAYTDETEKQKAARKTAAERDGKEAMEHAKKIGVYDKLFGEKKAGGSSEDALAAMIQKRQSGRSSFLDNLEAKYAAESKKSKGKKGSKKRVSDDEDEEDDGMPSEEAFQAAAARLKNGKGDASEGRKSKRAKR
jgi:DnaJ family protein C protein 9